MMNNVNWMTAYPEIFLLAMACLITLVDLWVKSPKRDLTYGLTMLTLGVVAVMKPSMASVTWWCRMPWVIG